jgi:hypothetical protein
MNQLMKEGAANNEPELTNSSSRGPNGSDQTIEMEKYMCDMEGTIYTINGGAVAYA